MARRVSIFVAPLLASGCFSPSAGGETKDSPAGESSSGTSAADPGTSTTADDPASTDETSDEPAPTDSTAQPTTETPTTADPTGDAEPFCGDGNIDFGEECDDGVENNGLDQSCLPDCNLNVCGDGNLGPEEFCDDGEGDNVLEVGACAPDCSTVIEEKVIAGSSLFAGGNHQPNPVGFADSLCQVGFRALFSVPGVRQATDGTPYAANDPIDWPLARYTAYARLDGTPIWITDDTPLLGVRDGAPVDLENPIVPPCVGDVAICSTQAWPVVTGLEQDWTPALSNTCNGWSTDSDALEFRVGEKTSVSSFLDAGTRSCSVATGEFVLAGTQPFFYCVEE